MRFNEAHNDIIPNIKVLASICVSYGSDIWVQVYATYMRALVLNILNN